MQSQPAVAAIAEGGFVVVWASDGQDGSGLGIYGQRFGPAGARVGLEFGVNTVTDGAQAQAAVAGLKDGGFVVTWETVDGGGLGIAAQRYDAGGARAGGEMRVNTTVADDQAGSSVAGFEGGGFVVVWASRGQDGGSRGIYGQGDDATGQRTDVEFRLNTRVPNDQCQASVASLAGTSFVAAWTSKGQDGSLEGVYGQLFDLNR
jgi:hypothetical protein